MAKKKNQSLIPEIVSIPNVDKAPAVKDSDSWIEHHKIGITMLFLGSILLGVIAFYLIPVSLFPETAYPGLTVETEYYGVGPEKIEEIITKPIEESISTLGGIEQLFSISEEGKSKVHIQFDPKTDLDSKSLEIRDKVEQASIFFPRETQKPVVLHYDPNQRPVFIIVPRSPTLNIMDLREISDREIKKLIEGINGVSDVIVAGGKPREIHISCDTEKMISYGISMDLILEKLQESNLNDSSGEVEEGTIRVPVYVKGRLRNLNEIQSIILKSELSGKLIRIEDVSKVSYSFREESSAARVNGENTVSIYVYRAGTANLLAVSSELLRELKKAETNELNFEVSYNQAETITIAIRNFTIAAAAGFILFLSGFYLLTGNFKTPLIIIILFCAQFFICSIFMYFVGIDYNLVTISGLILSTGCSLTVFLSCLIFSQSNVSKSTILFLRNELLITILLICGVFLPIVFSTKELKTVYGGLGFVLIVSFSISFVLSIIFLPMLKLSFYAQNTDLPILQVGQRIKIDLNPVRLLFDKLQKILTEFTIQNLERANSKPGAFIIILSICCLLGIAVYSFSNHEFINKVEEKQLIGNIEFPSGTSFTKMNETTEKVEAILANLTGIKEVNARIESGQSSIVVKFNESVSDADELGKIMEDMIGDIKPAFIYFSGSNDESLLKEVTIDIIGDDLNLLDKIVREVSDKAQQSIPNIRHVLLRYKPPREEVKVVIDKDKSESLGISSQDIGRLVRFGIQGGVASKFLEEGREIDIRIQYDKEFRNHFSDLKNYRIESSEGRLVPLLEIASLNRGNTPVRIYRKNKRRVLSFSLRLAEGNLSSLLPKLEELKKIKLPEHYRVEFGEQLNKILENQKRINYILTFAALILFMIMASFLESFSEPLLLITSLPIPVVCIICSLYILNFPLTIPVYLGLLIISALAIFESLLLMKEFKIWRGLSGFTDSFRETISDFTRKFFLLWCIIALFYIPQLFVLGTGSFILRTISLTVILGLAGIILFVPIVFLMFYLFSSRLKESILEFWILFKNFFIKKIYPYLRSKFE